MSFCILLLLFSIPWLAFHQGLPTGDIQKSIIWATDIISTRHLPNYQRAITDLNRDPVDFYTPGLHTLLAYTLSLNNSLLTAGFFAIMVALATAGVGMVLAQELFPHLPARSLAVATGWLILTNLRYLRYLREPGYHIQNSLGEFFLFSSALLTILLLKRWTWRQAALLGFSMLALACAHQFSIFIAGFALLPFVAALARNYYQRRRASMHLWLPLAALMGIIGLGFFVGLHHKIPHIFTLTPHLTNLVPTVPEYFSLLGPWWFALGISGLILLLVTSVRSRPRSLEVMAFEVSTLILLLLSQAPHVGIDIPPVRALFYTVLPLSITGAYALIRFSLTWRFSNTPRLSILVLLMGVLISSYTSLVQAYTLSHDLRTNSTLLPAQRYLVEFVQSQPRAGGILIDDYNRRSASWLVLSNRPMFTRIAADLGQQMREAGQSPLRYQLYLNQLDYEKIFSLGSHPAAADLMVKHAIRWVTGIAGSSADAFAHNPALALKATGGDIGLYEINTQAVKAGCSSRVATDQSQVTSWLLRASTLVNDIGDGEDTFEHLPASLRTSRLSEPLTNGACTYRTSNAQYIPLSFNVGDYVAALWDQDQTGRPDTEVELLLDFASPPTQPLAIRTPGGISHPVLVDGSRLHLPANELPFDERGLIVLTLENPTKQVISFDLIALGLAQIP